MIRGLVRIINERIIFFLVEASETEEKEDGDGQMSVCLHESVCVSRVRPERGRNIDGSGKKRKENKCACFCIYVRVCE